METLGMLHDQTRSGIIQDGGRRCGWRKSQLAGVIVTKFRWLPHIFEAKLSYENTWNRGLYCTTKPEVEDKNGARSEAEIFMSQLSYVIATMQLSSFGLAAAILDYFSLPVSSHSDLLLAPVDYWTPKTNVPPSKFRSYHTCKPKYK